MAKLRVDPSLIARPSAPALEIDVYGSTLHACIDEATRRTHAPVDDAVLVHRPGSRWRISDDVDILLNGTDIRRLGGLGATIESGDVIEARPHIGFNPPL